MSRLEEVKNRKPFAWGDIFVYALLAVIVVALFCAFVFFRDGREAEGILIEREGAVLYTYDFAKGGTVTDAGADFITEETGENYVCVTIKTVDGAGYNVVYIDVLKKTVRVTEANCSRTPDCVYMEEIKDRSGGIVCVPHRLKIIPLAGESLVPSTG